MNFKELRQLILLVDEKDFAEFELEQGDFKLRIKRHPTSVVQSAGPLPVVVHNPTTAAGPNAAGFQPVPASDAPVPAPQAPVATEESLHIVSSPIVGTFYRAPSPTAEPFVRVGDHVEPGAPLCIVEAMKLMNEILSDAAGEVVKIYVENAQPVEYGQPLFGIKLTSG
jgi:acetyl-CoA carboxylase biotin carboxyl carrier protein